MRTSRLTDMSAKRHEAGPAGVMRIGVLLLVLALSRPGKGQASDEFSVSSIPSELLSGVHAVVRLETVVFDVVNESRATRECRRVVTVLDAAAASQAILVVPYDKFSTAESIHGVLRDATGKVLRRLGKKDVIDVAATADFSLYDDSRARVADLSHHIYPYTVEFGYQVTYTGLVAWPAYFPQSPSVSVEEARFTVRAPKGMPVRHRTNGSETGGPKVTEEGAQRRFEWIFSMLPPRVMEDDGPPWAAQVPFIEVASSVFEIDGQRGSASTWEGIGAWYHMLGVGQDLLPPEAAARVRELVREAADDRDAVRRIYEHLQQSTRYVSIQLGIGGWKPFDAAYVFQRGYGDCKALTNYLKAMLKQAGIASYPALVRAGDDAVDLDPAFPDPRFNHVILLVPINGDSLWLEATSQTTPFGHLGMFTEDRYALVTSDAGGELVRTPRSRSSDNRQVRRGWIDVLDNGDASARVETRYTGNQQDRVTSAIARASGRDRDGWLRESIGIPSFTVKRADFIEAEGRRLEVTLPVELDLPRYAARTGNRLFVPLNLMERWSRVPPAIERRTQRVRIVYPYLDVDSLTYQLPPGYRIEALPDSVSVETPFATYHSSARLLLDGTLLYRRRLEFRQTSLPPDDYPAYRAFVTQIVQADRAQAVLVKK